MAIYFGSASQYVRTASLALARSSAYTWAGWVYLNGIRSAGDYQSIFSLHQSTTVYSPADQLFLIRSGGTVDIGAAVDGGTYSETIDSTQNLSAGIWLWLALIRSSSTSLQVYRNNASILTNTAAQGTTGNWTVAQMGSPPEFGSSDWLDGRIAHAKLWSAALTTAQLIREQYVAIPQRTNGLLGWWPMLPGVASAALQDFSGAGLDLTASASISDAEGPPIRWSNGWPIVVLPAAAGGSASKDLTDTETVSESASVTADVPAVDALGLAESILISVSVNLADSVALAESSPVEIGLDLSDTPALSESFVVDAAIPISDTLGMADSASVAADLSLTDTASAGDSSSIDSTTPVDLTDSASLSEAIAIAADLSLADALALADSIIADAALDLSDTLNAGDSSSVDQGGTPVDLNDSATLSEVIQIAADVSLTDSLAELELIAVAAELSLTDTLGAADSSLVDSTTPIDVIDSFSLADSVIVTVDLSLADGVSLADAIADRILELSEAYTLGEVLTIFSDTAVVVGPPLIVVQRGRPLAVSDRTFAQVVSRRAPALDVPQRARPLLVFDRSPR